MIHPLRHAGFTLLEMAIVLSIVALLSSGFLLAIPAQRELQQQAATERQLAEAREALLGYAAAHGHLPCPAKSSADGDEDRTGNGCTGGKRNGLLPWAALGTARNDAWGRLLRYSVTPAFTDSSAYFKLESVGDIAIRTRDESGTLTELAKKSATVAAVWSTGRNGHWGWLPGSATPLADASDPNDDEDANSADIATGILLVSRTPAPAGNGAGEFDDLVTWLPRSILFNRMIAGGRLP